jgi:hypothetical protein
MATGTVAYMRDNNLHSFAVLAHNDSPYLSKCLKSLICQRRGSPIFLSTSTPSNYINKVAGKFNLEVYINAEGGGIADDWTFAYNQAWTKYVTLAHQDDIYLPDYTRQCLTFAEKYKENLITFTDYFEIFNDRLRRTNLTLLIKKLMLTPYFIFKSGLKQALLKKIFLSFGSPIACPSVMYNTNNIRNFSFSRKYSLNLDWDAWLRLAEMKGDFVYINKKLMYHRIHRWSETTKGLSDHRRRVEDRRMFERIWGVYLAGILSRWYSLSYRSNT